MKLPPIVDRELRVAARRTGTFRLRFLAATGAALLGGFHLLVSELIPGRASVQGRGLFEWLAFLGFACALLAGPVLTADSLSRERREGTLGFLFLTDLGGFDIVAGKLVALGIVPVYGLLAVFPIAALSIFMGGITGAEFWRTTGVILNTTLLSLTLGLWMSSLVADERRAVGLTVAGLGFLTVFPEALAGVASWIPGAAPIGRFLRLTSPSGLLASAFEGGFLRSPAGFAAALAYQHALAWLVLGAAAVSLRTSWRNAPAGEAVPRRRQPGGSAVGRLARIGEGRLRRLRRAGPIATLAWRSSWTRKLVPWVTAATLGAAILVAVGGFAGGGSPLRSAERATGLMEGGLVLLKFLLVVHTAYFLQDTCRSGAMELLLTTPLSSQAFRQGHLAALREMFAWPVVLVGVTLVGVRLAGRLLDGGDWPSLTVLYLDATVPPMLGMLVHALDFVALAYHATTWSLHYDRPFKAVLRSTLLLLALPHAICGWGRFIVDLLVIGQRSRGLDRFRELVHGWHFGSRLARVFGTPRHLEPG